MSDLAGKVAVVTGGASGLGLAIVQALAEDDARVVVADLDWARASEVVADLEADGGKALAVTTDVSDESSVIAMTNATIEAFDRLDVLVNCAGLTSWTVMARDSHVVDADTEIWGQLLAVNMLGPVLCCKHAIPRMLENGAGAIVNVSSVRSLEGAPVMNAYAASKAGLNTLTRNVATSFGRRGIRSNAVLPGTLLTPATAPLAEKDEGFFDRLQAAQLLPRSGTARDVAEIAAFLASDRSFYLQGQLLVADGGASAHQRLPLPDLTP